MVNFAGIVLGMTPEQLSLYMRLRRAFPRWEHTIVNGAHEWRSPETNGARVTLGPYGRIMIVNRYSQEVKLDPHVGDDFTMAQIIDALKLTWVIPPLWKMPPAPAKAVSN